MSSFKAEFRRGELHREGALEMGREFPPQSWVEYESACRQGRTGGRGHRANIPKVTESRE